MLLIVISMFKRLTKIVYSYDHTGSYIASGIALVVILLVLNLTIVVDTLNGLIFYANIIASDNTT